MAAKVRSGLGDATVDGNQVPGAETFTAGSLEAAHVYVRAQELQWAGKYEEAIAGYKKALQLDKDLGRAYGGLGVVSNSLGRRQEAEDYFKQALKLLDGMTDREKYRTRSAYFLHTQNPVKAREELEALVAQFPADSTALNNLAVASWQSRDMARALELGRKASAIYPNNVLRRNNVALFAMYAGDFATAEQEAVGVLTLNRDFAKAYFAMAMSQLALGRPADAEATWQQLKAKPTGFDLAAQGRADMAVYEGRLSDAAGILEEALAAPPQGRSPSTTARLLVSIAEVRELQGRGAEAIRLSEEALATVKGSDHGIVLLAGLVMIKAGRVAQALELAADLARKIDPAARMNGKLLEGEADLKRGNAVAAYNKFEEAQNLADSWLGRYGLGRAQLEAGDFAAADQEFDRCLRKRNGEATNVLMDDIPTYRLIPPARYYMGRAQEGLGSLAAADSYKVFLDIKQKGDEQGLVADARRRLAALPRRGVIASRRRVPSRGEPSERSGLLTGDPDPVQQAALASENPHDVFPRRTVERERRSARRGDADRLRRDDLSGSVSAPHAERIDDVPAKEHDAGKSMDSCHRRASRAGQSVVVVDAGVAADAPREH